jgi:hypothetical protein
MQPPDDARPAEGGDLTLAEAWKRWGPPELVAELDELLRQGAGDVQVLYVGGPISPADQLYLARRSRLHEIAERQQDWLRGQCATGALIVFGIDTSKGFDAPRIGLRADLAGLLTFDITGNTVGLRGGAVTLQDVRVRRGGEADVSERRRSGGSDEGAHQSPPVAPEERKIADHAEAAGPRGYERFDLPLAKECITAVKDGKYSSDWAATGAVADKIHGHGSADSKRKRLLKLIIKLRKNP